MRIVTSGTHSVGKSTVVWDFLKAHPDYIREEEPYRALCDNYDIKFGKDSTRYCNGIQLFYNISRVQQYQSPQDKVIFDRSPVDYIAYSLYTAHYHQTDLDMAFVESLIEPVRQALTCVDVLFFVSINQNHLVDIEDDGIRLIDEAYRSEVDAFFKEIYFDNRFDVLPKNHAPKVVELWGSREARIDKMNEYLS